MAEAKFLRDFVAAPGHLATELVLSKEQLDYIQQLNVDLNVQQARAFLSRYDGRLNPEQRRLIENFATIREQGALARRWRLVRYGLWKRGVARNLGLLLAI